MMFEYEYPVTLVPDETAGGFMIAPYYTMFGADDYPSTDSYFYPGYVTRTYYKAVPGTYTFRMEGSCFFTSGPSWPTVTNAVLKAIYYPTAYGSVSMP